MQNFSFLRHLHLGRSHYFSNDLLCVGLLLLHAVMLKIRYTQNFGRFALKTHAYRRHFTIHVTIGTIMASKWIHKSMSTMKCRQNGLVYLQWREILHKTRLFRLICSHFLRSVGNTRECVTSYVETVTRSWVGVIGWHTRLLAMPVHLSQRCTL